MLHLRLINNAHLKIARSLSSSARCRSCLRSFQSQSKHVLNWQSRLPGIASIHTSTRRLAEVETSVNITTNMELSSMVTDPPFVEMGLATGWTPPQLVESLFEFINVNTGCPWWLSVAAMTLSLRLFTMPLFIASRRHNILVRNHAPKQQDLMSKIHEAEASGDKIQTAVANVNFREHLTTTKTGPSRTVLLNLPMPILFISMMMAMRQMTNVPVPSLQFAQCFWLDSLCASDPLYILPVASGAIIGFTMYVQNKSGMASAVSPAIQIAMKYAPFAPVVLLPLFIGHWPAVISLYMLTNSIFTLATTYMLTFEASKKRFNIPEYVIKEEGEPKTITESWKDFMAMNRDKALRKTELRQIKVAKKNKEKDRKKILKGAPPVTYTIGTEAFEKKYVPDFERDTRPPKPINF